MSRSPLRDDKTCLNCYHVAEKRFCPNCGQENTETRKTFYHLFVHFFEDLTHYENAFWKTIRNLIFRPAALTKEYMSGKRMSYLAPFRLYIFISFVTFLFIASLPDTAGDGAIKLNQKETTADIKETDAKKLDSILKKEERSTIVGFESIAEFDSIQKAKPEKDRMPESVAWVMRKMIHVSEKNSNEEIIAKFKESFIHNLPKVLFIYMPLFALVLWLFQSKKKYYYFDHGIFTLHYFSFLLLMYFLLSLIESALSFISEDGAVAFISGVTQFAGVVYMIYYFFPAHHRYYGESRLVTVVKGSVMFMINLFFITLILVLFAVYTFITIH
ncbi:MAG TPA: DUF3667 domain-containing protein [Flavobacterium sp.]|jgi:hypothetical protein